MVKKILCCVWLLFAADCVWANNVMSVESTPFRIMKDKLLVVADVVRFQYHCVQLEDGSIVYELQESSSATSGTMYVTVYCDQLTDTIILPLQRNGQKIVTAVSAYPVKFKADAPSYCHEFTKLIVKSDLVIAGGYVLELAS